MLFTLPNKLATIRFHSLTLPVEYYLNQMLNEYASLVQVCYIQADADVGFVSSC